MSHHARPQTVLPHARWRRVFVSALAFGAIDAGEAGAQVFPTDPQRWAPDRAPTSGIALGDVDGDGDLDLVGGTFGDPNVLYLHDGATFSDDFVWFSPARSTQAVALGDVDRDGDLDLVCGNDGRNTLYLNEGGIFAPMPAWTSPLANDTQDVALGDVDGNGFLDLVCGNDGQSTLYLNEGGTLSGTPAWSGVQTNTQAVGLGDVNGDGTLDLVCGNESQNTLYLNEGGTFASAPTWTSPLAINTQDVALGDLDGDGDLDIVFGNTVANELYLNNLDIDGTFSAAWSSGDTRVTKAVALGDVDGDGDLDLMCGNEGAPNALYLNNGATFPPIADWLSGPANATTDVALGDVDGDGDLDLACGNFNQASTLYLNALRANGSGVISRRPVWSDSLPADTRAAALGDLNADGMVDLVCVNGNHENAVYLNEGISLATPRMWSVAENIHAIALGDVDLDGDLDLVCGNSGANTLYLNEGGELATGPAWISLPRNATFAVALGDVDGDGRPDLVCGNYGKNTLYLNRPSEPLDDPAVRGGPVQRPFRRSPDWFSTPERSTRAVALGDVDGDGDLDLVCGNETGTINTSNTLYRNDDGTLTAEPVWTSEENNTSSLALGDVDGDGDLDLVCGNVAGPNSLYLNVGGVFSPTPDWVSFLRHATRSVALGDADGDGDLDLFCGNAGDHNTLYRNDGTTFSLQAAWSDSAQSTTNAVALGDVDGDGDLDVVYANGALGEGLPGEPTTVYAGLRGPAYRGDPTAPRNHTPNNGAYLARARHEQVDENVHRVTFRAVDVEADPLWIVPEFQREGAAVWFPIEIRAASSDADGTFHTLPEGVPHSIEWDVLRLPRDDRPVVLRLRGVSHPSRAGVIRHVSSYTLPLGRITPARPEIVTSVSTVAFPTVTVGGTVTTTFTVTNVGAQELAVTSVRPDPDIFEIRLLRPSLPVNLAAGTPVEVELQLEPLSPVEVAGRPLVIESDDPLRPRLTLPITVDVRALEIESRLLSAADPLILGDAVPVIVTPRDGVTIENGFVHHRPVGGTFESTPLSDVPGRDWAATIPADRVTEVGLEWYVEVRNGDIRTFDPGPGPDAPYTREVASPAVVTARPTSSSDHLEGREIEIEVEIPDGAMYVSGTLHYRRGGEAADDERTASLSAATRPSASIPADAVAERGVEFWVRVRTATAELYDPADSSRSPHMLPVTVGRLQEPRVHRGARYRILSLPLAFVSSEPVTAMLSDQAEFGPYDPKRWQLWRWVGDGYAGVTDPQAAEHLRPEPGRAFWVITKDAHRVDTAPVAGRSVATDRPYEVVLPGGGWTMLGHPFAFAVPWDAVQIGDEPSTDGTLLQGPIRWNPDTGDYDDGDATLLEPFDGYWIHNAGAETTLRIPPFAIDPTSERARSMLAAAPGVSDPTDDSTWQMSLEAASASGGRADVVLGVRSRARDGHDRFDRLAPPPAPGPWIRLGVENVDWPDRPGLYGRDFRAPGADGHRFDLALRSAEVEAIHLAVSPPPTAVSWRIVDLEQGVTFDPAIGEYRLLAFGPDRPYRIAVVLGSEEFVARETQALVSSPATVVLDQNAPNPFGRDTRVRYGLPHAGVVRLDVFDVRGARVVSLVNGRQPAGYHTVVWDGRDERGRRTAAGVYFYRVSTPEAVLTRKMARLR